MPWILLRLNCQFLKGRLSNFGFSNVCQCYEWYICDVFSAKVLCVSKTRSVIYINSGRTAHRDGELLKLKGSCHKLQCLTDHEQFDSISVMTQRPNSMWPPKLSEEINENIYIGLDYLQKCRGQAVNCGTLLIRGKGVIFLTWHSVQFQSVNANENRKVMENWMLDNSDENCYKLPSMWKKNPTCENWIRPNNILIYLPFLLLNGTMCFGGMNEILSLCLFMFYWSSHSVFS